MEWISTEDRLPELKVPVLIKEEYVDEIQVAFLVSYSQTVKWQEQSVNHICHGDAYCEFDVLDVTHWMPLPEPPKAKE